MPNRKARPPKPFLSLHNAAFRLGDRLIFENTTWSFGSGEQWAIIGANGSGKSVLADGLRGRLPLVQGELRYHFKSSPGSSPEDLIGHVAFEDRKSELHGTVVQSRWTSFEEQDSVSVRDFLSYERVMDINPFEVTPGHRGVRARFERRLNRAVRLLQISGFLSRSLLSLSNGERQRVQLARSLAQPLRLLILDEPYVGLDIAARRYFHHLLEQLLETDLRVLVITARVDDLPRHVTHLLHVDDCRVVAAGRRAAVLSTFRERSPKRTPNPPTPRPVDSELNGGLVSQRKRSGANLLELRNVTVRYGSNVILSNLNWTVREGESWALLGPNGSGKTTLLSLVQGDNPQAYLNEVSVFGRRRGDGESVWHLKKRIGCVSPELQLHFDEAVPVRNVVLSGFHETIGLFEAPTKAQASAARQWLIRFDLLEFSSSPLGSLSAGLQRMTFLARALVKNPRLLILDEPCQGLDPEHRDLIIRNVDALIRKGVVTAIFVTHRPEEIPPTVKRVLRLKVRSPGFTRQRQGGSRAAR